MDTDGIEMTRPSATSRWRAWTAVAALVLLLPNALHPGPAAGAADRAPTRAPTWAISGQGLRVVSADRVDDRLVEMVVATGALARPVRIEVLLPTGYSSTARSYPVLYLFHGTGGGAPDWTTEGDVRAATAHLPLIVVMPDGGYDSNGGGWWTDWVDQHTALGAARWETFHIDRMIPWIDAHLRTITDRSGRAVAGLSQGAFGAFSYAARHPDMFVSAASFSGPLDLAESPPAQLLGPLVVGGIMMASNRVQPFAPFGDPVTHASTWRGHNPASLVTNLRGTDLRLWSGNGFPGPADLGLVPPPLPDPIEIAVHESSVLFARAADAAGVRYVFDDYGAGLHRWHHWNRDLREYLPHLMRVFAAHRPPPGRISYRSVDGRYAQWGWQVRVRRSSGPAFTGLSGASARGFTYTGADAAVVTTAPIVSDGRHRVIVGTASRVVGARGHRLRIEVPAGTVRVRIR